MFASKLGAMKTGAQQLVDRVLKIRGATEDSNRLADCSGSTARLIACC
jgi:hypothetical protein